MLGPRLEWADRVAAGRHLDVYHVYDVPLAARLEAYGLSAAAIDVYSQQARSRYEAELAALVKSIGRVGVTSLGVDRGDPAVLFRRHIESVRPSLVVLGKHVRRKRASPPSSAGSVCRFIADSMAIDVLVVV